MTEERQDIVEWLLEHSQNLWTSDKELKYNLRLREAADELNRLRNIVEITMKGME